eukprot:1714720-Pyramimonas_sp.AAC.1
MAVWQGGRRRKQRKGSASYPSTPIPARPTLRPRSLDRHSWQSQEGARSDPGLGLAWPRSCLLYTSPSPRDRSLS